MPATLAEIVKYCSAVSKRGEPPPAISSYSLLARYSKLHYSPWNTHSGVQISAWRVQGCEPGAPSTVRSQDVGGRLSARSIFNGTVSIVRDLKGETAFEIQH
jgi:hypothetical protein